MPNSLSPLPAKIGDARSDQAMLGTSPMRHRIAKKFDAVAAHVPTRPAVPARSVTPIY